MIGMDDESLASKLVSSTKFTAAEFKHLSDGQLRTDDGHTFPIHRIQLAKKSGYFHRLFCGDAGGRDRDHLVPGVRGEVLLEALLFAYSGKVCVTDSNACELLLAANRLAMDHLVQVVMDVYVRRKLNVGNCLRLLMVSLEVNQDDMVQECLRFILTHFESVVGADGLALLPHDVMELLLGSTSLRVLDEAVVWEAVRAWTEADSGNRQHLVPSLLRNIAIDDLSESLADKILKSPVVKGNPHCGALSLDASGSNKEVSSRESIRNYVLEQRRLFGVVDPKIDRRRQDRIHFIAHFWKRQSSQGAQIYATYDGKIDLWRKLVDVYKHQPEILTAGQDIYIYSHLNSDMMRYSLVQKQLFALPRLGFSHVSLASLDGWLYVVGAVVSDRFILGTEPPTSRVARYRPLENAWQDVSPAAGMGYHCAAAVGGRIYAVSRDYGHTSRMVAQEYSADIDRWSTLPPPAVSRTGFALAAHGGRLYVLGGRCRGRDPGDLEIRDLREVEVFDPKQRRWVEGCERLPWAYFLPRASVVDGVLVVHDSFSVASDLRTNPLVMWDEGRGSWVPVDESSPLSDLHEYGFVTPDDEECIDMVARENKVPWVVFSRSPFT